MRVLCAWCQKEGKPALIGEKEPLEDPAESHGLCAEHRKQVEDELARHRDELARHRAAAEALRAQSEALRGGADALREKVDP